MQHLHACFSLMFWPFTVWMSIPERMRCFNQFVYAGCAAKSVEPRPKSEAWLDSSDMAPSQCFKKKGKKKRKLRPDFLLHTIFNQCPLNYFLVINQVFRFRNQSLSIPCKDEIESEPGFDKLCGMLISMYSIPVCTLECSHLRTDLCQHVKPLLNPVYCKCGFG